MARILSLPGQKVAWSILFVLVSAAVLAPLLAPHSPNVQDLTSTLAPPSGEHLLGTDDLGRDQLSRLLFGLRTSLAISAAVTFGVMVIGLPLGMLAGFTRGIANTVIARLIDVGLALPSLLLALALIAAMGAGVTSTLIALVAGYTPYLARVTRSVVLKIREEEYIDSAAVSGVPTWRIIVRHVTPNMIESVSVQLTLIFAFTVIAEAGLSFVGLGIQPPTSSLGNMLALGSTHSIDLPLMSIVPGCTIALVVITLLVCGDGLRHALDPRSNR
ncbi:ABC transporter permease [Rhodococcus erythropolis]